MELQWVHRPRTVVMADQSDGRAEWSLGFNGSTVRERVVMARHRLPNRARTDSFNGSTRPRTRGYGIDHAAARRADRRSLQWVHASENAWLCGLAGPSTCRLKLASMGPRVRERVVMDAATLRLERLALSCFNGSTRPRTRGYGVNKTLAVMLNECRCFNGSTRPRTRGYAGQRPDAQCAPAHRASMGPPSENGGYGSAIRDDLNRHGRGFNGSTVRERWLWQIGRALPQRHARRFNGSTVRERWLWRQAASAASCHATSLQWVHRPRTVVMVGAGRRSPADAGRFNGSTVRERWLWNAGVHPRLSRLALQWVHRPITVVMPTAESIAVKWFDASMGPPSENGGYGEHRRCSSRAGARLQWVHRPRTVVMCRVACHGDAWRSGFNGSTVRERWLCVDRLVACRMSPTQLQWVHRPITVVMIDCTQTSAGASTLASMGPPSENGGYGLRHSARTVATSTGFNGSTVRERWLWATYDPTEWPGTVLQWVHRPRTVVMAGPQCLRDLQVTVR